MKKVFLSILITALVATGVYFGFVKPKDNSLKGWTGEGDDIIGSSTNLKTVPGVAVFGKTTTTPATGEFGMNDGGAEVMQDFVTENFDLAKLFVSAKGDTSTSTLFLRQMASYDGRTFFDIATSTDARITATTTLGDMITAVQFEPGLATTTKVLEFKTYGYKFTRFVVWSENLSTDPNDGVQAHIKVIKVIDKK